MRIKTHFGLFILVFVIALQSCNTETIPVDKPVSDLSVKEKNLQIKGKDVFLQGFYTNNRGMITDNSNKELELISDAGFNLIYMKLEIDINKNAVQSNIDFLNRCNQKGVYVIADYFGSSSIVEIAKAYKDYPAILGFSIQDDANAHATGEIVLQKHLAIKTFAPDKYTLVSIYKNYEGGNSKPPIEFVRSADLIGYQTYPIGHWALDMNPKPFTEDQSLQIVDKEMSELQLGNQSQRPIVTNPQTFRWVDSRNNLIERVPTPDEFRIISYIGIINGAKSLLHYSLHEPKITAAGVQFEWKLWESEVLWNETKILVSEINQIKDFLLNGRRAKVLQKNEWISAAYWNNNGTYYLIVANLSVKDIQNVDFKIPAMGELTNVFSQREGGLYLVKNTVNGSISPAMVHVYRINK